MQKINKFTLLFSIGLIILLSLSSVSAEDDSNACLLDNLDDGSVSGLSDGIVSSSVDAEGLDSSLDGDLIEDEALCSGSSSLSLDNVLKDSGTESLNNTYYVDNGNFNDFFADNVLRSEFVNSTIVFNGSFDNYGVLGFYSNDTVISSIDSSFYNTVFDLGASGITLYNIDLVLDGEFEDNEYAGIFIHADNVTVYNCTINYTCPENVTAFGIYSNGHHNDYVGLNIVNNTINFIGHAFDANAYNYPILLRNTHDSLVYGNAIDCELPVKYIVWSFSGAYGSVSMDTVAAFAADYCENLTLSNNHIHSSVNGGDNFYPTLDTVILYGCSYSLIENNTIISEDFFTPPGQDNYLQALDLYRLNDVTVIGNNISVFTNGGKAGMGTAYPIQINGPAYNVKVAFNNLTTFNNGPNCGIYSQNFYGDTFIDIISNFINVTGNASNDGTNPSWCLVSGIEVQDTGDNILNNTIIVNNLGDYKSNAYVYGISYVQNTGGGHTYNIQYNNITTNGNYGVKILGNVKNSTTYNSTISNNVINTQTTSSVVGASTNRQVEGPTGTTIKNNTNGNPRNVMSDDYYPDWLKDYVRNGSGRGTGDFAWLNRILNPSSNGTGFSDSVGNGTAPWGSGNASGSGHGNNDGDVSGRGNNSESSSVNGNRDSNASSGVLNGDLNSTLSAPGISGFSLPSSSISSPSDSGSSAANPNAYEIDEHDNVASKSSDYLQLGLICMVALMLLIIGYKRQKDKEEEE
ncbi:hypothetical protein [Methanobrevibacter sp.]